MTRRPRFAFTLVELLVVLAVVAVLMTILMPALSGARRQAKQIVCRNNLRGIFSGVLMYAQEHNEHVPLIEPLTEEPLSPPDSSGGGDSPDDPAQHIDRTYDPFDPERPQAVGNVLSTYVEPGSWVCPSAITGYPRLAAKGEWTVTYAFRTAQRGPDGELTAFVDPGLAFLGAGSVLDPVITNYSQFDGRPLRYLNGRRYVHFAMGGGQPLPGFNFDRKTERYWATRWPLIWDSLAGEPNAGAPRYPHRGLLENRPDLGGAEDQFKTNTNYFSAKTGYIALFADGDVVDTRLTRDPMPHRPGI